MAIKKILTEPNKILRQVSKSVKQVTKEEQDLMNDMLSALSTHVKSHSCPTYLSSVLSSVTFTIFKT